MNATHIHLLLNHFPIIGTLIGSIVIIFGIFRKNQTAVNIGSIILALMALIAIPVYLTGEPAEESVEKLPGVSEALMEAHEDAASAAIWMMELTGLGALISWFAGIRNYSRVRLLNWIVAVLSVLSVASMARTGYLGGQIRHSEIRSGAPVGVNEGLESKGNEQEQEQEQDDD